MDPATLEKLEHDLVRIPGVRSARVVGGEKPSEIHVLAIGGRHPKQIARDVQTLAQAGFGVQIDRRIISVVQLADDNAIVPEISLSDPVASAERPSVELVLTGTEGKVGWVRVYLGWPNGERTEGHARMGLSRELRARGATEAAVGALDRFLESRDARLEVEHVMIQAVGPEESILVRATYYEGDEAIPLLGSALVNDDVVGAGVRALLHAANRKLIGAVAPEPQRL